jgi:hypothetical protein
MTPALHDAVERSKQQPYSTTTAQVQEQMLAREKTAAANRSVTMAAHAATRSGNAIR